MVLSKAELLENIQSKNLIIDGLEDENIEECSIKLFLSNKLFKVKNQTIDLKNKPSDLFEDLDFNDKGYILKPNEFILCKTKEKITLGSKLFGLIDTAGSIANLGLQVHLSDFHIDPGTNSQITLQLKNNSNNNIVIYPDVYVAKLYIFNIV